MVIRRQYSICTIISGIWMIMACCLVKIATGTPAENYTLLHFDNENGLPQNSVWSLTTDKAGYLWFCTQGGLVRFDGAHFMIFNSANVPGMQSDRIVWLGTDKQGTVYFGDEFGRSYRQDAPCAFAPVPAIDTGGMRALWAYASGVYRVPISHHYRYIHTSKKKTGGLIVLSAEEVYNYYIPQEAEDQLTLEYLHGDSVAPVLTVTTWDNYMPLFFGDTLCMLSQSGHAIFVHKGRILHEETYADLALDEHAFRIFGQEHFIYREHNLYQLLPGPSFRLQQKLLFRNLPCEAIVSIYRIPGTRIYAVGTPTDGLYLFYPKSFSHVFYGSSATKSLNNTYALAEWKNKIITGHYTYNTGTELRMWNEYREGQSYSAHFLFIDRQQQVWFPDGMFIKRTGDLQHFRTMAANRMLSSSAIGMGYCREDSSRIFFVMQTAIGFVKNDSATMLMDMTASMPQKDIVFTAFLAADSTLLIGATRGLYEYHIRTNTLRPVDTSSILNVRVIYRDREGLIWIGTYGQGLYLLQDRKLIKMPAERRHPPLSIIHCILEDTMGYFWISTNKGIYKTGRENLLAYVRDPETDVYYYAFHKTDGLPFYEFNGGCMPCAVADRSGMFWFPALKGLVFFSPANTYVNTMSGNVQFDFAEVDGSRQDDLHRLSVPHDFLQLTLYLSCPYYSNAENLRIEYKIAGYNDAWQQLEAGKIIFNSLPTGHYRLVTRKREGFAIDRYAYASLAFEVLPAFYETFWFRTLSVIFIILSLLLIFRLRYRYILIYNLRLEREVKGRTLLLQQLIADLQESNAFLKISEEHLSRTIAEKDRLVSVLVHDLRSPLRFLKNNTSYLSRNWKKYSSQELNNLIFTIDDATRQIHFLSEELMYWIATRDGKYVFDIRDYALSDIVYELAALYRDIIAHSGNRLEIDIPGHIRVQTDKTLLKTVLRNLLDNANKNTEEGLISIRSTEDGGRIRIILSDTGMGMTPDMLQEMNGYLSGSEAEIAQQAQFGHKIIRDFILLLQASIRYVNNREQGVTVIIELKQ